MLEALQANAARLGLAERVYAIRADAESLPFPDGSFDLVVGHAVLHHLPDLERAFSELLRVLEPGGRIVFAGEPSRIGDRLARVPKRAALLAAPAWRRLVGAAPAPETVAEAGSAEQLDHELEGKVDIHAFAPADLTSIATHAGFADVSVRGEELVANWFGWFNRTLEMSAEQADIPMLWRKYAFHGYLLLQKLDQLVLEPRLPAALFYNLLLTARKPLP
jgi:SAM-dependent methyltransferase